MKFTKMHGIGNDYVYVNCFTQSVPEPEKTARFVSDRHFGIGSDGLILIKPSKIADFEMEMYNADGSRGAMCGNGIRCVAKYVYDYGLTDKTQLTIEALGQIKYLDLTLSEGKVASVRVNIGKPELVAKNIPVLSDTDTVLAQPVTVCGVTYQMTCVSMGNPHCVVFLDDTYDLDQLEIEKIGPCFENHPCFPNRVNTEFVKVLNQNTLQMRVWERGSAETLACGTGACAVAVAGVLNGYTKNQATVKLRGGDLEIFWDKEADAVYMTGPATVVYEGEIDLP